MGKSTGLLSQEGFMDFFDYDEDQEILMRDIKNESLRIGEERGEKRGIRKTQEKIARKMIQKNYEPEVISELTGLSTSKIKSFML